MSHSVRRQRSARSVPAARSARSLSRNCDSIPAIGSAGSLRRGRIGMPGKFASACRKNQLSGRTRRPCAHQGSLALDSRQDLLPAVVANVLESQTERLIEVDRFVKEIDRALGFALPQSLLAEAGAEGQHFERAEIASAAGDNQ